jgi:hypothetical protein
MALSLTPNPETESEDLATVLSADFVRRACLAHDTDMFAFWRERENGWRDPVTLQELRDWLGY